MYIYFMIVAAGLIIGFYSMSLDEAKEKEAKTGRKPNVWD